MMRDKKKSETYWSKLLVDLDETINEIHEFLRTGEATYDVRVGEFYSTVGYVFDVVSALYSAGTPMPEVITAAKRLLVDAYPKFVSVCREDPDYAIGAYGGGWDFRTRYLALAVLSRLTPDESRPLVEAVDFWPERDAVWERFIAYLGHGEGRPSVVGLVWPDAYAPLYEAMDPDGTDLTRLAALMAFDKNWLKEMRSATNPFYSNEKNKNNTYVGYWDFEAAAVAVMMRIEDVQLRKSETYPGEWADWARLH